MQSTPLPALARPARARLARWLMAPALLGAALWLSGCAQDGGATASPSTAPKSRGAFEQQHLAQARQETAQGDLAEAAYHWEVLTVLRPDEPEYEDKLAQTRARIERAADEGLRGARQAQQRGALDEAVQRYLGVLALRPQDKTAAEALRAIERERVKREQLGKYSARQLMPRVPPTRPTPRKPPAAATSAP